MFFVKEANGLKTNKLSCSCSWLYTALPSLPFSVKHWVVLPTIAVLKSGINYVSVTYRDVLDYFCNSAVKSNCLHTLHSFYSEAQKVCGS